MIHHPYFLTLHKGILEITLGKHFPFTTHTSFINWSDITQQSWRDSVCLLVWESGGGGQLQTTQLSFLLHRFVVFWRHFLSPLNTGKFGQISASRQSSPRSCVTVGWPWHTKLQEAKCFDTTLAVQECVCAGIKWKTTPWSSTGLLPNSFISH